MANISTTLRKVLQTRSAEDLDRLAQIWAVPDLDTDAQPRQDAEGMGILDIIHARFAWEALSLNARELLRQIISLQIMDGVPRDDLQKLSGLDEAAFVAALTQLEQNLMLIEARPSRNVRQRLDLRQQQTSLVLMIPEDFRQNFARIYREIYEIDRSEMHLSDNLATLAPTKLQTISLLNSIQRGFDLGYYGGMTATPTTIAVQLAEPHTVTRIWEQLSTTEHNICLWLSQASGNALVSEALRDLNMNRSELARHLYRLENFALVFPTFVGQEHRLFLDRAIRKIVNLRIKEEREQRERTRQLAAAIEAGEQPPIVYEGASQLLSDLAIVVNAVHQMVIEPTQAGYVPKRLANKIAPLLHGSRPSPYEDSDYYLEMVFSIAESLKLINLQHSKTQKSRYTPASKLPEWMEMTSAEQTRRLLTLWEKASERAWSDVAGVNYRPNHYGFGAYLEAHASRQGLLEYLAEHCQPGKWYMLSSFLETLRETRPLILHEHSRYASYNQQRQRNEVLAQWSTLDGEIIVGMLSSSLHEMGLVALGFESEDSSEDNPFTIKNPDAFAFTELAAQVIWNNQEVRTGADERPRTLIVQPNFELLLLQPDYPTLYKLLPFTKVVQIDMVSRLTLTQDSVRRGVETGWGVAQIISVLQACSQKELPQNVLYTLQDWGRLYKNATISQMILIEVSSEAMADEIFASPKLRSLELRRLGPCAIAVGNQVSLQVLRTALEKEGIILHIQGDIMNARDFAASSTSYGRRK
ncbi:MAG TPA: helicase-associated domain-containing protein [Ktedonobacteraceae bacterium]|nr:helicase-associated domain-containing protein [Ktedonobacteraceae bacterium]